MNTRPCLLVTRYLPASGEARLAETFMVRAGAMTRHQPNFDAFSQKRAFGVIPSPGPSGSAK